MNALSPTDNFDAALAGAARAAADWLIADQKPDGHWVARADEQFLHGGAMVSGAVVPRPGGAPFARPPRSGAAEDPAPRRRLADLPRRRRTGTSTQRSRPTPRCARSGIADDEPALTRARAWIESKGGLKNIRVFTRYWLALIGEWPWDKTPNLPPEVIWFPLWFPFSIYNFAQWARATLMPIALLSARRPTRPLPPDRRLDALFPRGPRQVRLHIAEEMERRRLGRLLPRRRQGAARPAGRSASASARASGARPPSPMRRNGSCAIRMPTAPGAASSRRGSIP